MSVDPAAAPRRELRADCERCSALCCVAPAFAASADFAVDKPAATPCHNLQADFRCAVHTSLRQLGFGGCTVYDCFGAGQHVSQTTFAGRDWRRDPDAAPAMFAAFAVVRSLHELLWYVEESLALEPTGPLHDDLDRAADELAGVCALPADQLIEWDVASHRERVNLLLRQVSERARSGVPGRVDLSGADLVGRDLRTRRLVGGSLRGAVLVGADLAGVDLSLADLTGADLRSATLRGADLRRALFVTQSQMDSARGDATTQLAPTLRHPLHWLAGS